jgi:hypothetical protein
MVGCRCGRIGDVELRGLGGEVSTWRWHTGVLWRCYGEYSSNELAWISKRGIYIRIRI